MKENHRRNEEFNWCIVNRRFDLEDTYPSGVPMQWEKVGS